MKADPTLVYVLSLVLVVTVGVIFFPPNPDLSGQTADVSFVNGDAVIAFKDAHIIDHNPKNHSIQIETKDGHSFYWQGDVLVEIKEEK